MVPLSMIPLLLKGRKEKSKTKECTSQLLPVKVMDISDIMFDYLRSTNFGELNVPSTMFRQVPIPPGQVYAINDVLSAEGAADDYETCLKHLVKTGVLELSKATGFPKFDLMLLGMGPDGHLASLFPGHPLLHESQRWVTFINDSPKPPPERITFTFPVINSSAYIALVVTGAGKAGAVHHALAGDSDSNHLLPVQMVKLVEGEFTWFTDKAAVSKLQNKAGL